MGKTKVSERRRRLLAAVHVAKKQLGLDDETYRAVLRTFACESAAELTDGGLMDLMRHFERCGFKTASKSEPKNIKNEFHSRQLAKIKALLTVGKKTWAYADGIAQRMYGIEKAQWLDGDQVHGVIAALIKHGRREGWAIR